MEQYPNRVEKNEFSIDPELTLEMDSKAYDVLRKAGVRIHGNVITLSPIVTNENKTTGGSHYILSKAGEGQYEEIKLIKYVIEAPDDHTAYLHIHATGGVYKKICLVKNGLPNLESSDEDENTSNYN